MSENEVIESKTKSKKTKQPKVKKVKPIKPKNQEKIKKRTVSKVVKEIKKGTPIAPILQMLVVIVNRGKGDEVVAHLKSHGIMPKVTSYGEGTADSTLQSMLGLYNKEKEIVFSVIPIKDSDKFMDELEEKILKQQKHGGIAFTIPLKSITRNSMQELV